MLKTTDISSIHERFDVATHNKIIVTIELAVSVRMFLERNIVGWQV